LRGGRKRGKEKGGKNSAMHCVFDDISEKEEKPKGQQKDKREEKFNG